MKYLMIPPPASILTKHVPHVIELSAKKQMRWVDAATIVAGVKHMHAIWNRAAVKFVRHSMRKPHSCGAIRTLASDLSIPILHRGSRPHPTPIRDIDVFPKAFADGSCFCCSHAVTGTILGPAMHLINAARVKVTIALKALLNYDVGRHTQSCFQGLMCLGARYGYNRSRIAIILLLTASSIPAYSQTTATNIDIRATTTVIVTGVSTNSANTTLSLVYSTAKDKVRIDGLAYAYGVARTPAGGTFTNTFDNWIAKTWTKDNSDATARAKLQADAAATLIKISDLLNNNYDLLTAGDISNLNTIAAKSPITP